MQVSEQKLNIFQKINAIREKVAYVRKDKKVENYMAVTFDAIVAETRAWFIEFGVLVFPTEHSGVMVDTGVKSAKGNPLYRYEGVFDVVFANCDQPGDILYVRVTAHANDYGDKACGKALTYATKAAILKVLMLETGENDEARQTQNLKPGEEVEEHELKEILKSIGEADTMDKLVDVYQGGYKRAEKDREAQQAIIKAKDARKAQLSKGGAK